jgi:predicted amidohydrolase YtcJ
MPVSTTPVSVYVNGNLITSDPDQPTAEAMAVACGQLLAVGSQEEARAAAGPAARVIDLGGRCVIPGLTDTHTHLARHALEVRTVECRDFVDPGVDSVAELMRRMAAAAPGKGPGEWVIGTGAMRQVTRLAERRWPTRAELDEAVPANPAYIAFGSHVTVANSLALAAGGIDRDTPDPTGGHIDHLPDGEPSGLLLEHAQKTVARDLTQIYGFDDLVESLRASLLHAAARGVTCIHDMVQHPDLVRAYQVLQRQGQLPIRVGLLFRVVNADFSREALPGLALETGFGNDMLWFNGAKLSIDGGFTGRSAAFKASIDGHPLCEPIVRVDEQTLAETIDMYNQANIRMCVHAIGDLAVDQALHAFEKAGAKPELRHRIEHFGNWLMTQERMARAKAMGLTPVPNPPFLYYLGEDAYDLLGGDEHYARDAFPFRTMVEYGFKITAGSDGPGYYVVDGLRDMATLVNRTAFDGRSFDPAENLTVGQALRAQTIDSAWLGFREDTLGSLSPGKRADFVVLDSPSLFGADPAALASLGVLATVVDGRLVHGSLG